MFPKYVFSLHQNQKVTAVKCVEDEKKEEKKEVKEAFSFSQFFKETYKEKNFLSI